MMRFKIETEEEKLVRFLKESLPIVFKSKCTFDENSEPLQKKLQTKTQVPHIKFVWEQANTDNKIDIATQTATAIRTLVEQTVNGKTCRYWLKPQTGKESTKFHLYLYDPDFSQWTSEFDSAYVCNANIAICTALNIVNKECLERFKTLIPRQALQSSSGTNVATASLITQQEIEIAQAIRSVKARGSKDIARQVGEKNIAITRHGLLTIDERQLTDAEIRKFESLADIQLNYTSTGILLTWNTIANSEFYLGQIQRVFDDYLVDTLDGILENIRERKADIDSDESTESLASIEAEKYDADTALKKIRRSGNTEAHYLIIELSPIMHNIFFGPAWSGIKERAKMASTSGAKDLSLIASQLGTINPESIAGCRLNLSIEDRKEKEKEQATQPGTTEPTQEALPNPAMPQQQTRISIGEKQRFIAPKQLPDQQLVIQPRHKEGKKDGCVIS